MCDPPTDRSTDRPRTHPQDEECREEEDALDDDVGEVDRENVRDAEFGRPDPDRGADDEQAHEVAETPDGARHAPVHPRSVPACQPAGDRPADQPECECERRHPLDRNEVAPENGGLDERAGDDGSAVELHRSGTVISAG